MASLPAQRNPSLLRLFAGADRALGRHSDLDELTGLPNRNVFERRLERLLGSRQHGRRDEVCTVMLIDCDAFREVNQSLGYLGGDRVIADIAERLRESLPAAHTIARVGGDEFGVLFDEVPSSSELMEQGEQLISHLHEPLQVGGASIGIAASIGIVLCTRDDARGGAAAVLRGADIALRLAKDRGKGRFGVFEPSMRVAIANPDRAQPQLADALSLRQYSVRFQPIVQLPGRVAVGVEALLRWSHPDGRELEAAEFVPELERTGMISEVGRWVVAEACAHIAALRNECGAGLFVMVNISGVQLRGERFVESTLDALRTYALEPGALVLELTESSSVAEDEVACATLRRLRAAGVRIALDDVGAGYSSTSHLQRMPVDALKIDPSFVSALVSGSQGPTAADDLFRLARALGLDTIAEGVETVEQHNAVVRIGCRMAQGYCYAPPLSAQELARAVAALLSPR